MAPNKKVCLTHHELLELIAVVRTHKEAAINMRNKPEAKLMSELTRKLLTFNVDGNGTSVELDRMERFSLWMCMENYVNFCVETHQIDEYATAVLISTKLSG